VLPYQELDLFEIPFDSGESLRVLIKVRDKTRLILNRQPTAALNVISRLPVRVRVAIAPPILQVYGNSRRNWSDFPTLTRASAPEFRPYVYSVRIASTGSTVEALRAGM
jgi:hypothetical protein